MGPSKIVKFTYRNWRGEVRERRVVPQRIWFGFSKWHPEEQWLLNAVDEQSGEERDFAMKDISGWETVP